MTIVAGNDLVRKVLGTVGGGVRVNDCGSACIVENRREVAWELIMVVSRNDLIQGC